MGSDQSKPGSRKDSSPLELNAYPGGLVAVSPRFMVGFGAYPTAAPKSVTLRLNRRWWSGAMQLVGDNDTGQVWFGTQGKVGAAGELKVVLDGQGAAAFGMKEVCASMIQHPHSIFSPNGEQLSQIFVESGAMKATVRARVLNIAKGSEPVVLHMMYKHSKGSGVIYAGDPKQGGPAIAYITPSLPGVESARQEYFLVVAPFVDAAICMSLCIALDSNLKSTRVQR